MIARFGKYLAGPGLGPLLIKTVTGSAGLRIVGMGFSFLVGVQLARGLGAEGYGIYGVAMSIIALLAIPTEFGLPQLLTREVAAAQVNGDWGRLKGVLRWATRTSLVIAIVIATGMFAWLLWSGRGPDSPLGKTLLVGTAMVPLVGLVSLRSAALRGLQHIVKGQLPDVVVRPAVYSALLLVASATPMAMTPASAMLLGAVSAALAWVVAAAILRKEVPREVVAANPTYDMPHWLSSALPMALTEGTRVLQGQVLIILIGLMMVVSDVGHYRVAISVAMIISVPVGIFGVAAAPIIAKLHASRQQEKLQRMLGFVAASMTAGTTLLALPFYFYGQQLISLAFGPEFTPAAEPLIIISVGMILSSMFGANIILLNMTGHQKIVTWSSMASLFVLLIAGFPLVATLGINGAAIASTASLVAWKVILWRYAATRLSLDTSFVTVFRAQR